MRTDLPRDVVLNPIFQWAAFQSKQCDNLSIICQRFMSGRLDKTSSFLLCSWMNTHTHTHTHIHSWMDGWFVALAESYTFVEWCQSSWQTNHNHKQHIVNSAQRSEWIKHSGCVRFSFNVAYDTCTRAALNGFYRRFCPKWQPLHTIYSWELNPWPWCC